MDGQSIESEEIRDSQNQRTHHEQRSTHMRPAQVPSNTAPKVLSRDGTGGRSREDSEVTPAARITVDDVKVIVTGC